MLDRTLMGKVRSQVKHDILFALQKRMLQTFVTDDRFAQMCDE